jgi:hypothetical protein
MTFSVAEVPILLDKTHLPLVISRVNQPAYQPRS